MPEPIVRRAGPADAEALADIGRRTFTETFGHLYPPRDLSRFLGESHSAGQAARDLADPARAAWLAEVEGRAIGYALAGGCALPHPEATPTCGELKRLYVLAEHQGEGLGEALFGAAMAWLDRNGARQIWIGVWSENHRAQRFYRRFGFESVGEYIFPVGETDDLELIFRRRTTT